MIYPRAWINVVSAWKGNTYDAEIRLGDRVGIGYAVHISAARSIVIEDDVSIARERSLWITSTITGIWTCRFLGRHDRRRSPFASGKAFLGGALYDWPWGKNRRA